MYSLCPYCKLDSAGQHEWNCPNYTTGTKDNNPEPEYLQRMPQDNEAEIVARLDKIIELFEKIIFRMEIRDM